MLIGMQGLAYLGRHKIYFSYLVSLLAMFVAAVLLLAAQWWTAFYSTPTPFFTNIVHIQTVSNLSLAEANYYLAHQQSFERIARLGITRFRQRNGDVLDAKLVDPAFFDIFPPRLVSGRIFTSADAFHQSGKNAIINQKLMNSLSDTVGYLDTDSGPVKILGIVDEDYWFPINTGLWVVFQESPVMENFGTHFEFIGKLNSGISVASAETEMNAIFKQYRMSQGGATLELRVKPFAEMSRQNFLFDLTLISIILLTAVISGLVSIGNLLGLDLLRRDREWRISQLLGMSVEKIIVNPLVSFSAVLLLGLVLGFCSYQLLKYYFSPYALISQANTPFWWGLSFSPLILLAILFSIAAIILVLSLLPTYILLKRRAHAKTGMRVGRHRGLAFYKFQWLLLSIQIFSTVIIVCLVVALMSLYYYECISDRGFKRSDLLVTRFSGPGEKIDKESIPLLLKTQINGYSNNLAVSNAVPGSTDIAYANIDVLPSGASHSIVMYEVSQDFFSVMDIALEEGRGFNSVDREKSQAVTIVDQATAEKMWPNESPLGQEIVIFPEIPFLRQRLTIVGVASAIRSNSYQLPTFYRPLAQGFAETDKLRVIISSDDRQDLTRYLDRISKTSSGFSDARPIESILRQSGDLTLSRILNFMPACILIVIMLIIGIQNTAERILVDYQKNIAIYQVCGWSHSAIVKKLCKPLFTVIVLSMIFSLFVISLLDVTRWFNFLLVSKALQISIVASSMLMVVALAIFSFVYPCLNKLGRPIAETLKSKQ